MSAFAWSNVLLWVAVGVHTVLLVAILRHLGASILGAAGSGAGKGPVVRTRPPAVPMETLDGSSLAPEDPESGVRNVFFLSTACKVCHYMLEAWREVRGQGPADGDVFVIQGEVDDIARLTSQHQLDPRTVVPDLRGRIFKAWDVAPRPFLVVLDERGLVKNRGRPEGRERLTELLRHDTPQVRDSAGASEGRPA